MKREFQNFNKNYKLWLACAEDEFRPAMNYIHFRNNYAYASDAYILIRVPLAELVNVPEEQAALLNGFSICSKVFKYVTTLGDIRIEKDGERIAIIGQQEDNEIRIYLVGEDKIKAPAFEKVLEKDETCEPLSNIGIKPNLLARLSGAMGTDAFKMEFTTQTKKIFISPSSPINNVIGVIMPIYID